jgi:hypothetical protein
MVVVSLTFAMNMVDSFFRGSGRSPPFHLDEKDVIRTGWWLVFEGVMSKTYKFQKKRFSLANSNTWLAASRPCRTA